MKKFATLYIELEQEQRFQRRIESLASYFQTVSEEDGVIALSILLGFKIKSIVKKEVLAQLACEAAHVQFWMFDECLSHGNNYLDTVSWLIPRGNSVAHSSLRETFDRIESLGKLDADDCRHTIANYWSILDAEERIVLNQMFCGVFKFEVSFDELSAGLALCFGLDKALMSIRLSTWKPVISSWNDLRIPIVEGEELALPEVFHPRWDWYNEFEEKMIPEDFHAKWVMDGVDVQVIKLKEEVFIWGRNNELYRNRFPEVESFFLTMKGDFMLHGTLVGWSGEGVDKVVLQKRASKKSITAKVVADFPVRLIISEVQLRKDDSPEYEKVNGEMFHQFLQQINHIDSPFIWNEEIDFKSWEELFVLQIRQKLRGSLGLEIYPSNKKENGVNQQKRYFKKNEPHSLNLILLYVKSGTYSGDMSGEEYTFGIQHESSYLPIARVTSIHDDVERTFIREFVKTNTLEKFGPVRNVKPMLVFKISFASIYLNERKKSGVELVNSKVICRLAHVTVEDAHQMKDVLNFLSSS